MRLFITGVDADGTSRVVSSDEVEINSVAPGFAIGIPYNTTQTPPPARPAGNADLIDQFLAPGLARWMVVEQGPNTETPKHHTDTLDLETVLSGSVDLILDDGVHHLEAGDMVVMTGVDHAWKAGPDGYRMSAVLIGTPPPA
ncbi:quercetin dioxygenase-like cupin family protein [Mycolicibacterium sp. BK556]|uniref:cupin domain-containing protein n=1 Tax=unclassified Mycolicibacterium TaxID=2636767 RepID=UPI001613D089|nr:MULTISPECIES: cupin domain-containing protein [unclassified Mycolicibacterium]MBB3605333.1 quercetin dioxygenase-like cupin family protein [Mycolicibacterium sp. BK556]MBB3635529.1 quercetin dioxygenase-like cupin family protein [Mycolicibacterium sp. BK607]